MRIAFLVGAGVSIPAELPSTREITERVLSGEDIMRHTNGNYDLGSATYTNLGIPDKYVPKVVSFLNKLKIEIDRYYLNQEDRFTNYEDIYYVASQIRDSESGDYDNPAVQSLIDRILPLSIPLLVGNDQKWQLYTLAEEATNYIHDVVYHLLNKEPSRTDHLNCLIDAYRDKQMSHVDIFSLNHDTVIEKCLSEAGINVNEQFTDGFGKPEDSVRYWKPDLFESESFKVRLFKLHGSLNWFRFRPNGGDWSNESIVIPPDFVNTDMDLVGGRPEMLVGTFNKIFQYTRGIYADIYCKFYRALPHSQQLVISGYGFGDKGINTRIAEWIYSSPDRKIILIHKNPEELRASARGAISNKWGDWIKQNKLIILKKWIEETSWDEIRERLI